MTEVFGKAWIEKTSFLLAVHAESMRATSPFFNQEKAKTHK